MRKRFDFVSFALGVLASSMLVQALSGQWLTFTVLAVLAVLNLALLVLLDRRH